jgi:hypothetical protein
VDNVPIPIETEVKHLGVHLDQKLTWKTHTKAKRLQLELEVKDTHWLMKRKIKTLR